MKVISECNRPEPIKSRNVFFSLKQLIIIINNVARVKNNKLLILGPPKQYPVWESPAKLKTRTGQFRQVLVSFCAESETRKRKKIIVIVDIAA